jgi:hypothetical protein
MIRFLSALLCFTFTHVQVPAIAFLSSSFIRKTLIDCFRFVQSIELKKKKKTSILRVLQAIPSPLPVVYSIKIVQAEQN